jgi:anaerobic selenocysteine-containing dehydrogenase
MVQRDRDPLTGAVRDAVLVSREDAEALSIAEGDRVRLVSDSGEFHGVATIAAIHPGNLAVHWPEGNALLSDAVDQAAGEPDYNAWVTLEKAGGPRTGSGEE